MQTAELVQSIQTLQIWVHVLSILFMRPKYIDLKFE